MKHLSSKIKLIFWFMLISIMLMITAYFISEPYHHWQTLRHQHQEFSQQWQKQRRQQALIQHINQDSILLKNHYDSKLNLLHQPITLATLLTRITLLIKTQELQLSTLKPIRHQFFYGLNQETITLDIQGKEQYLLNFLKMLMKQSWWCDIQKFQFDAVANGMRLQATLDIYHVAH